MRSISGKRMAVCIGFLLLMCLGGFSQGTLLPMGDIPLETVKGGISSGSFSSGYQYDIWFSDYTLNVELRIGLKGYDPGPLMGQAWETEIEDRWNHNFDILDGEYHYHIHIDADFFLEPGEKAHQTVTIIDNDGRSDMLNWYTMAGEGMAAHEFGHMLGLYDEYYGGGLDPVTGLTDYGGIMGDHHYRPRDRHYHRIFEWFQGHASDRTLSFTEYDADAVVPEPAGLFLLIAGSVWLQRIRKGKKI